MESAFHEYRRDKPGYAESLIPNLGMLFYSKPTFLERICRCGQNGSRCKNRSWCPRCAYADATQLWKTYLPNYHKGTFWFVTVSIKGEVPFDTRNCYNLRSLWLMLPGLLNQVSKAGFRIRGFYSSAEVSVRHFLPLRICPHVHTIIDADDLDSDFQRDLKGLYDAVLHELAPEWPLEASVNIRRIDSKPSLKSALRYLVKPIVLHDKYKAAWSEKIEPGLNQPWELNSEVRDFITGVALVSHYPTRIQHIKGYGSMNAASQNFMGVVAARRNDNWDEIQAIPLMDDDWKAPHRDIECS